MAAGEGHLEICNLLLDRGADPDPVADGGVTPLILAGLSGHVDVIKLLISKGVNIDACVTRAYPGSTLLCLVSLMGQEHALDVAKVLLQNRCDANAATHDGDTPLSNAIKSDNLPLAGLLLENNANPNMQSAEEGQWPLHHAVIKGNPAMVRLLLEHGADPRGTMTRLLTPLHLAALLDNENALELVKLLLDSKDIDLNAQADTGDTALMLAVQEQRKDVVEALLEAGVDPELATTNDITPLERAITTSNIEIFDLLIKHGANPRRVDQRGISILHLAAIHNDVAVLERVLKEGLDLDLKTHGESNVTALQLAIAFSNNDIALRLLDHGAQP
ncbi:hypothetical protein MKX07_003253 [Trichoderma sp. CBMAI-0711]|nr:hypothetical protein MKX07_003253 [Trichoderma sp. CBMAI-0711]